MRINRKWVWGAVFVGGALTLAACGRAHRSGEWSEQQIQQRLGYGIDHVLSDVDASEQQLANVKQALGAAVPDVLALRAERKALADDFQIALRKQRVDPAELEALRQRSLDLVDRASARGMQALAEAANHLNADQRAQLVAEWKQRTGS